MPPMRILTVALVLLAGCAPPPSGSMIRSWVTNFGEYNINVVFPMREAVQPGDVFLVHAPLELGPGTPPQAIHVDSLNLINAWEAFAPTRMELPPDTREVKEGAPFSQPVGTPQTRPLPVEAPSSLNRPRLAAFPELQIARTTAASLGLATSGSPLLAALGLSSSNEISVRVEMVEHVAMPLARVFPEINAWMSAVDEPSALYPVAFQAACTAADAMAGELVRRGISPDRASAALRIGFVTEIFTARAVSYTALDQTAGAASASAILGSTAELSRLVGDARPDPVPGATGTGQMDPQLQVRLASEVERIRREVGGLGGGSGSFTVRSAAGQRVALVQRFERPLVFGWRGILFQLPATQSQSPICGSPLRPNRFGDGVREFGWRRENLAHGQPAGSPNTTTVSSGLGTDTAASVSPTGIGRLPSADGLGTATPSNRRPDPSELLRQ